MSLTAAFVFAVQPLPMVGGEAAPLPHGVAVRGTASAEILRVGRASGENGPEDIAPQRHQTADGRILAEFR